MLNQPRLSVVLADDNDLTRTALRLMISGEAYRIAGEAASGRSALEMVLRLKPDIVCLDINMPDLDGLDVLQAVRAALPHTAVLMVTASNDVTTIKRAITLGAAGFIVKPFTPGVVQDGMAKAAAHRRKAGV